MYPTGPMFGDFFPWSGGGGQGKLAGQDACADLATYYDVSTSWTQVTEAGGSGRSVKKLTYVNGDTSFCVEIINKMNTLFFKAMRGRYYVPFRVFVSHPTVNTDKQEIEVAMAFPEAIAQSEFIIRDYWARQLPDSVRNFYKVVYWDLWTWEKAIAHHHDMYCTLDRIK